MIHVPQVRTPVISKGLSDNLTTIALFSHYRSDDKNHKKRNEKIVVLKLLFEITSIKKRLLCFLFPASLNEHSKKSWRSCTKEKENDDLLPSKFSNRAMTQQISSPSNN